MFGVLAILGSFVPTILLVFLDFSLSMISLEIVDLNNIVLVPITSLRRGKSFIQFG